MAAEWKDQRRRRTIEEIKSISMDLLESRGLSGLSLGAIARALGVSTPALYHYFSNRDALLAALIADTSDALLDAVQAAAEIDAGPATALHDGISAYRTWALAHPEAFRMVFAPQQPGDSAADLAAGAASTDHMAFIVARLAALHREGGLKLPAGLREAPSSVRTFAESRLDAESGKDPALVAAAAVVSHRVRSVILAEIAGSQRELYQGGSLFRLEVAMTAAAIGARPPKARVGNRIAS